MTYLLYSPVESVLFSHGLLSHDVRQEPIEMMGIHLSIWLSVSASIRSGWLPIIISSTTHHIASILELWTQPSHPRTWLAYHHTPVIFRLMQASNTTCSIAFILELWTHLNDPQTWSVYFHTPVIIHQTFASDWSIGLIWVTLRPN